MKLSEEKLLEELRGCDLALKQVKIVVLNYVISLLKNRKSTNVLTLLTKLEELDAFVLETAGKRIREICQVLEASPKIPSTTTKEMTEKDFIEVYRLQKMPSTSTSTTMDKGKRQRDLIVPSAKDDLIIDEVKVEPCDDLLPFAISPVQGEEEGDKDDEWIPSPATRNPVNCDLVLNNEKFQLNCETCGKRYGSHTTLRQHQRKAHPQIYPRLLKIRSQDEKGNYNCETCGKRYGFYTTLRNHQRKFHPEAYPDGRKNPKRKKRSKVNITSQNSKDTNEESHHPLNKKLKKPRKYICSKCEKTYTSRSGLSIHHRATYTIL